MILIIDCGSSKTYRFAQIAEKFGFTDQIIKPERIKDTNLEKFEKIIISGGPTLLTRNKDYINRFEFVKTYKKPILGVCLGHQIIGLQYQTEIFAGEHISGEEKIVFVKDDLLFSDLDKKNIFREDHKEYIRLPKILNFWQDRIHAKTRQ